MNGLLEKYPKTAKVVREWFLEKMIESLKDDSVPDEFKEFMRQEGVSNEKLAIMIGSNPRTLFDVFDANSIYISVMMTRLNDGVKWQHVIAYDDLNQTELELFDTRLNCEKDAIEKSFDVLEDKL